MIDEQLQELHRFAELGRLSASLLHEISNPLTAALLHLELSNQRSWGIRQARRNMKLLRTYVEAARQQVRHHSRDCVFEVNAPIKQLKPVLLPLARQAGVRLVFQPPPDCQLYGDATGFQQIISNLVMNAVDACAGMSASDELPTVIIRWRLENRSLVLQVRDNGGGIQEDLLPHIFEPFSSSKIANGRGLGLGLAMVKHSVTSRFGGTIEASSRPSRGSCFTLRFPLP